MTDNYGEGLDRLRTLLNQEDMYQLVDTDRRASIVGWGTLLNTVYYVDGMVRLHQAGACYAANPLSRSAMEYGMWTVWLADMGEDAVDAINRGLQNGLATLIKEAGVAGKVGGDLAAAMQVAKATQATPIAPARTETYLSFKNLLDAYDPATDGDGTWRYRTMYDAMSKFVHPTMIGAQVFFETPPSASEPDKDDLVVSLTPRFPELLPCLEYGLGMLHMAMLAYNELLIGKPWTAELEAVAEDFGLDKTVPQRQPGK